MAFSTCSLNPCENESVVAELLARTRGAVELVDASHKLPELKRSQAIDQAHSSRSSNQAINKLTS